MRIAEATKGEAGSYRAYRFAESPVTFGDCDLPESGRTPLTTSLQFRYSRNQWNTKFLFYIGRASNRAVEGIEQESRHYTKEQTPQKSERHNPCLIWPGRNTGNDRGSDDSRIDCFQVAGLRSFPDAAVKQVVQLSARFYLSL